VIELRDFAQDMASMESDAVWNQAILEQEQEVCEALRRMLCHTHSANDAAMIVAHCGLTEQVFGPRKQTVRQIYPPIIGDME
jgi:hypothetical protein